MYIIYIYYIYVIYIYTHNIYVYIYFGTDILSTTDIMMKLTKKLVIFERSLWARCLIL